MGKHHKAKQAKSNCCDKPKRKMCKRCPRQC